MRAKKKRTSYNYDSDSSREDIPLAGFRKVSKENHTDALHEWSVEKCEFCEEVFHNKYSMLIHNASHIIIPLLKQKYHQCPECLHHFTTIECLEWHTINKHPNVTRNEVPELLRSFVKKEPAIIVKTGGNRTVSRKESLLQSFVKQQPITVLTRGNFEHNSKGKVYEDSDESCNSTAVSDIVITRRSENSTVGGKRSSNIIVKNTCNVSVEKCYDKNVDNCIDSIIECKDKLNANSKPIKDRLLFEDDVLSEADTLINDLTTDCTVKLETFDDEWINNLYNGTDSVNHSVLKSNAISLGNKSIGVSLDGKCNVVDGTKWYSIHYDELVRPEVYECSRCDETFPNRFLGIVHETSHLDFKRRRLPLLCRYCDWYITTAPMVLRKHVLTRHPGAPAGSPAVHRCPHCSLGYVQLARHVANYHPGSVACSTAGCGKLFPSGAALSSHRPQHAAQAPPADEARDAAEGWSAKIVRVCDLCYSFFRNKVNLTYEFFGERNQVGERNPCERCQKHFFSLNVVRLKYKKHIKQHIEVVPPQKKKPCSNSERLKNVQLRLKKLKSLNKF